jgi:hypothetical protein
MVQSDDPGDFEVSGGDLPWDWDEFGDSEEPEEPGAEELGAELDLPEIEEGEYLLLRPGEEAEICTDLPGPRQLPKGLAVREGEVVLCDRKRRVAFATASAGPCEDGDASVAKGVVLVLIKHRSTPPRSQPRRYLVAVDESGALLGWVDHGPPGWDFDPGQVRALCRIAGVECSLERYESEDDFEAAHAGWIH